MGNLIPLVLAASLVLVAAFPSLGWGYLVLAPVAIFSLANIYR